jgi:NAD(P)-dependent dehydrogenase (short-subunit alcohol dehydrogenase family)
VKQCLDAMGWPFEVRVTRRNLRWPARGCNARAGRARSRRCCAGRAPAPRGGPRRAARDGVGRDGACKRGSGAFPFAPVGARMSRMSREIEGSVMVVTGASSGIGRATAQPFAEHGARVVLAARSERSLREVADECETLGGQALVVPTDVIDEEAVGGLAQRSVEAFGRIDTWVNNAGVITYGRFEEVPTEVFRRVIETNLFGQIHGARAALSQFREQGEGVLVNMSSVWGRLTSPHVSAYVTSKFAIRAFSECLRQELAGDEGIDVVTILPQSVDTPISRQAGNYHGRTARAVPPVSSAEEVADRILRCARDPRREVTEGRSGQVIETLHALAPGLYGRTLPYVFEWAVFTSELVEPGPGNVLEPVPEHNRVADGWGETNTTLRRAALAGGAALAGAAGVAYALLRRSR